MPLRLTMAGPQPTLVILGATGAHMSGHTKVSRKLVAVFAADVEGYSRLMGADEVGTLKGLTERRAILDKLIGEHGGRIANTAGDSVLAEFGSAVEIDRSPGSCGRTRFIRTFGKGFARD